MEPPEKSCRELGMNPFAPPSCVIDRLRDPALVARILAFLRWSVRRPEVLGHAAPGATNDTDSGF